MANDTSAEAATRLLGPINGKRILELGCGAGEAAIDFAGRGATVIAVDESAAAIAAARTAAERAEVRIEWHAGDLADLAFLRADSVDAVYSDGALARVADPGRLFRQVHRVLRPGMPFVFTLPHPMALCVETDREPEGSLPLARPYLGRSYFEVAPLDLGPEGATIALHPHTVGDVFTGLGRAGYRVDTVLEPEPPRGPAGRALVPTTIIWRARKEGV